MNQNKYVLFTWRKAVSALNKWNKKVLSMINRRRHTKMPCPLSLGRQCRDLQEVYDGLHQSQSPKPQDSRLFLKRPLEIYRQNVFDATLLLPGACSQRCLGFIEHVCQNNFRSPTANQNLSAKKARQKVSKKASWLVRTWKHHLGLHFQNIAALWLSMGLILQLAAVRCHVCLPL